MTASLEMPPMLRGVFDFNDLDAAAGQQDAGRVYISFGDHHLDTVFMDAGQWKRIQNARYDGDLMAFGNRLAVDVVGQWLAERLMMSECGTCYVPVRSAVLHLHERTHQDQGN
jgi:hypothetical protein